MSDSIHCRPRQRGLAVMRRRGPQSKLDILAIARELAQFRAGDAPLKVLFDWSELDSWPFAAPSLATVSVLPDARPLGTAEHLLSRIKAVDAAFVIDSPDGLYAEAPWLKRQIGELESRGDLQMVQTIGEFRIIRPRPD